MDRNTATRPGELFPVPVAAGAVIHAGHLLCANAQGFGVMGKADATYTTLGVAQGQIDNSHGNDGDAVVLVRRRVAFNFANSGDSPVTQSSIGKPCYIVDSQTVAATNGSNTRPQAGIVHFIDADGVWVLI
jgi:hypothetical protein